MQLGSAIYTDAPPDDDSPRMTPCQSARTGTGLRSWLARACCMKNAGRGHPHFATALVAAFHGRYRAGARESEELVGDEGRL